MNLKDTILAAAFAVFLSTSFGVTSAVAQEDQILYSGHVPLVPVVFTQAQPWTGDWNKSRIRGFYGWGLTLT
jgi:hypothetical protein